MITISKARLLQMMNSGQEGIHIDPVHIELKGSTPSDINIKDFSGQLRQLGLTCPEAQGMRLKGHVDSVLRKIPYGSLSSMGVFTLNPKTENVWMADCNGQIRMKAEAGLEEMAEAGFVKEAAGEWDEGPTGKETANLLRITYYNDEKNIDNFKWLKEHEQDFPYAETQLMHREEICDTVEAIKKMFADAATACSAATVEGINEVSIKAIFSNALEIPPDYKGGKDLDFKNSRTIPVVLNYNGETHDCDGVGVVRCRYHVTVSDYKEKKQLRHNVVVETEACSALYMDLDLLHRHVRDLDNGYLVNLLAAQGIHVVTEVTTFDSLPPANNDTFSKSMYNGCDEDYAYALVFYKADMQKIGELDNTESDAEDTYSRSITRGFSEITSIQISSELSFELGGTMEKFGMKIGFSVSLTKEWSQSETITVSFTVPGRKKASFYQVFINCAKLRLDRETGKMKYVEYGRLQTDSYKTLDR